MLLDEKDLDLNHRELTSAVIFYIIQFIISFSHPLIKIHKILKKIKMFQRKENN